MSAEGLVQQVEVLVVGGGPVGLYAAIELVRQGYRIGLIEKRSASPRQTGGIVLKSGSLALLEQAGLAQPLIERGVILDHITVRIEPDHALDLNIREVGGAYPFLVALSQSALEEVLKERLAQAAGVNVFYEAAFISCEEQPHGVVSKVLFQGQVVDICSAYLLGCDGGKSVVRKSIGAKLEGKTAQGNWSVVDAVVECQPPPPPIASLVNGTVRIALPIGQGRYSITASAPDVLSLLPPQARIDHLHWQAQFHAHARVSNRFQKGRIFLAGDAAHLVLPTAGSGLNLGIGDVSVFVELLGQQQLTQYESLRQAVARETADDGLIATAILSFSSKWARHVFLVQLLYKIVQWPWIKRGFTAHFNGVRSAGLTYGFIRLLKMLLAYKIYRL